MTSYRSALACAVIVSLAIHVGAVAFSLTSKPDLEIEGGGEIQAELLGSSPFSTISAGAAPQREATSPIEPPSPLEPLQLQPVETQAVEVAPPYQQAVVSELSPGEPVNAETVPADLPIADNNGVFQTASVIKTLDALPVEASSKPIKPVKAQTEPRSQTPANPEVVPARPVPAKVVAVEQPVEPLASIEEIVPVSRRKPPVPAKPEQVQQATADKQNQSRKTEKKKAEAAKASKAGAAGQSSSTSQKGGSQRKGKSKTAGNSDVTNYPAKVHRKVLRAVRAPRGGGRLKTDAQVRFTVSAGGQVSGVRLVRSSGNKAFDEAALASVRRASPFPEIPPEAGRASWTFTVPIGGR